MRAAGPVEAPPATHSRPGPVIDAATTLKRHEAGLLSYFKQRITNATAERLRGLRCAVVEFTSDQIELRLDTLHRVHAGWQPQRRRANDVAQRRDQ